MLSLEERQAPCANCKREAYVTLEERTRGRWTCYQCGLTNLWTPITPSSSGADSIVSLLKEGAKRDKELTREIKKLLKEQGIRKQVEKAVKRLSYGTLPTMTTKRAAEVARRTAQHARSLERACNGCGAEKGQECERAWRCDACKAKPGEECRGEEHARRHVRLWK